MLSSTPLMSVLGSGVDGTDHDAVRSFIRAACGQGLALLLIHPGSKLPADMRSPQKRRMDDKAARDAAEAEGRRDWDRVKSPSGLALATTDADVVLRYLDRYIDMHGADVSVNLAVEVGASRLVVVDCDTRAQYERFLTVTKAPPNLPPTVSTPGQVGPDGTMVHSDGGHVYFTVPDGMELPTNIGALTWEGDDGFAVLWDRRYVLIPPSVRPEGRYEMTGRDYELTDVPVLSDAIVSRAAGRASRVRNANPTPADDDLAANIDAWAQTRPWADILLPLGWTPVGRPDNCGCEVWTAGDGHASPKSATAHDSGCQLGRYTETNAPLHIWTDHPGEPFDTWLAKDGSPTMTKLQVVALTEYSGDVGKAMAELRLLPPSSSIEADMGTDPSNLLTGVSTAGLTAPIGEPVFAETTLDATAEASVFAPQHSGVPTIAPFSHWRDMPPPEFVIDGLLEHGGLSSLIGPPGVGKSTVALDIACHVATGRTWHGRRTLRTKVLYLPGEGLAGAVQRIAAWIAAHDSDPGDQLLLGDSIIQLAASPEAWSEMAAFIAAQRVGLIIFDTFARMSLGLEENSATDVGKAVVRFDQIRKMTGAGVMVVHHTSKGNPEAGRGSSALNGALDSELLVRTGPEPGDGEDRPGKWIELRTSKQKNAEQLDGSIDLMMVNYAPVGAPIITGLSGTVDPFSTDDIVLARPTPEPLVETAIRIRAFVERFTEQGVTRGDILAGVRPDPYTASRRDAKAAWKQKVAEAVDRALRYELVETLSGTAAGQRYVQSVGTADTARALAAAEIITDTM
jgi:hypothetical protein